MGGGGGGGGSKLHHSKGGLGEALPCSVHTNTSWVSLGGGGGGGGAKGEGECPPK